MAERIEGIFAALLLVCALFVGGAFKLFGIEPGIVASVLALVAVFSFIRYCVKDMHSHGPQSRPPLAEVKQRARMP